MLKILINATHRTDKSIQLLKIEDNVEKVVAEKVGNFDIVTTVRDLLTENNFKISDIDNFAFVDGQGSFTGIKNSAAIANVLEWAVNNVPAEKLTLPTYGGNQPNIQEKK